MEAPQGKGMYVPSFWSCTALTSVVESWLPSVCSTAACSPSHNWGHLHKAASLSPYCTPGPKKEVLWVTLSKEALGRFG